MKKRQVLSIAIIIVTLAAILGCPPKPKPIDTDLLPTETKERIIEYRDRLKYVHVTDWLITLFVVGIAASIFMLVRGMATGFPLLVASIGGIVALRLDQSLAEKAWPYFIMGLLLLAGFVWYIYITFIHKRAFSDVVEGCERFKNTWRGQSIAVNTKIDKSFLAHQDTIQKQSTKRIVDKVQKKLKRKEKV